MSVQLVLTLMFQVVSLANGYTCCQAHATRRAHALVKTKLKTSHAIRQRSTITKEAKKMGAHMLLFEIRHIEDHAFLEAFIILGQS